MIYLWLSVIRQAKEGNKEAQDHLRAVNKERAEKGLPSLEEQLLEIARKDEEEEARKKSPKPTEPAGDIVGDGNGE